LCSCTVWFPARFRAILLQRHTAVFIRRSSLPEGRPGIVEAGWAAGTAAHEGESGNGVLCFECTPSKLLLSLPERYAPTLKEGSHPNAFRRFRESLRSPRLHDPDATTRFEPARNAGLLSLWEGAFSTGSGSLEPWFQTSEIQT
jgi:hypothetical protein